MIDKNLILLKDLRKCDTNDFEKLRFIGKLDLKKQLKTSLSKLGPVNYVTKNLINELKICDEFQEKIIQIGFFIKGILDKIEFKVLKVLIFCERSMDSIDNEQADYRAKFEEKVFEAFKLFSNYLKLSSTFYLIFRLQ